MKRSRLLVNRTFLTVALLLLCQTPLLAQEVDSSDSADADPVPAAAAVSVVSMADLLGMLKDQQSQLDDQKRQLSEQQQLIATLQVQATETSFDM